MCLIIRCKTIKEHLLFPFFSFIFVIIPILISKNSLLKEHILIRNIYISIGNILCFIPFLISCKLTNDKFSPENNNIYRDRDTNYKSLKINYEYSDKLKLITNIKFYNLLILSFVDFLQSYTLFIGYKAFTSNNNSFFWTTDILSIYILSKCFLEFSIHRHHILSFIIFCFFDIYLFYEMISEVNFDYWQILFILSTNFLSAFKLVFAKKLMDFNFVSYYKLNYLIGIISLIFNTITIITETIIDEKSDIPSKYRLYMDNFLEYLKEIKKENYKIIIKEIFISLIYIISYGLSNVLLLITISRLSPFHFLFSKVLLCVMFNLTKIIEKKNTSTFSIITICIYILSIFVLLLFLEVIEINCCNLNLNTKEQITERCYDKTNTFVSDQSINDTSSVSNVSCENNENNNNNSSRSSLSDSI